MKRIRTLKRALWRQLFRAGWVPASRVRALQQTGWLPSVREDAPVDSKKRPLPWLTYPAIDFLDQIVAPDERVLEIGGNSSLWWANPGNDVTVIEADEA